MVAKPIGNRGRAPLREGLQAAGQYHSLQTAGRFYPVACVALEITQKCNLDCTLCYLSEHAEQAYDVPLVVLFQRIEIVHAHYGVNTTIQITGGDPTLRKIEDIEAICREIRRLKMRSCLMTNGIRADRKFLRRLAEAGLNDVAFHVDLTQERKGFNSEVALNEIRWRYVEQARGLGLRILFNTTAFSGNIDEIPELCRFFRSQAQHLALVSFQMQAETGRGTAAQRDKELTQDALCARIGEGFGIPFPSKVGIGHSDCSLYDHLAIAGDKAISVLEDTALVERVMRAFEKSDTSGRKNAHLAGMIRMAPLRDPGLVLRVAIASLKLLWKLRIRPWNRRGRLSRLSVMVHSFMDSEALVPERCASCVFMVATQDGPLSMCVYNAERDEQLFAPVKIQNGSKNAWWSAATGQVTERPVDRLPAAPRFKNMKGRQRAKEARRRAQSK